MQEKKPKITWNEAPDIINPYDLADILGIGENKAREIFNREDFPRVKGTGVKQIADKQAVRCWCMNLDITTEALKNIVQTLKETS